MKVTVQVVLDGEDESTEVREVFALERGAVTPDTLGLQLAEAKDLRCTVQETVVDAQVKDTLAAQAACPHCATPRRHKDIRAIVVRTLFRTLQLPSPRWWHCPCQPQPRQTFRPLAVLLPQRSTPELSYLQAKFAALASYGMAATLLAELLPLGLTPARHGGPSAGPGRRGAPGRRARPRAAQLHRQLSASPGSAAPPGPAPCSSASPVATSTPASNSPAGTEVRGDRRQGHPGGRAGQVLRVPSRPTTQAWPRR